MDCFSAFWLRSSVEEGSGKGKRRSGKVGNEGGGRGRAREEQGEMLGREGGRKGRTEGGRKAILHVAQVARIRYKCADPTCPKKGLSASALPRGSSVCCARFSL